MAVDSDYAVLAQQIQQLAAQLGSLSSEVESRRASELANEGAPDSSYWVSYLSVQLGLVGPAVHHLEDTTSRVLESRRGDRVFR